MEWVAIGKAWSVIKTAGSFVKDSFAVAELRKRLADSEAVCAKRTEENTKLRGEVADLKERLDKRQDLYYENNVYWRRFGTGAAEGPFCPKCFDGADKPVRLSDLPGGWWGCPVCNWGILKTASSRGSGIGRVKNEPDDLF
jgi:hypothetical protein